MYLFAGCFILICFCSSSSSSIIQVFERQISFFVNLDALSSSFLLSILRLKWQMEMKNVVLARLFTIEFKYSIVFKNKGGNDIIHYTKLVLEAIVARGWTNIFINKSTKQVKFMLPYNIETPVAQPTSKNSKFLDIEQYRAQ